LGLGDYILLLVFFTTWGDPQPHLKQETAPSSLQYIIEKHNSNPLSQNPTINLIQIDGV
jgi:hypothetical protein